MEMSLDADLTTLTIETRILGWGAETIAVPLPGERLRVVDLICAKIAVEWAEWERGVRDVVGRESLAPESFGRSGHPGETPPGLEGAIRAALDGYRAGWYIVLVDGAEPGGLDSWLDLDASRTVAFVRVYPLPGARPGGR